MFRVLTLVIRDSEFGFLELKGLFLPLCCRMPPFARSFHLGLVPEPWFPPAVVAGLAGRG